MVFLIILGILYLAVLELNKNTLLGWILALIALIGFALLRKNVLLTRPWLLRAGSWIGLIAALSLILALTQGPYRSRPAVDAPAPAVTDVVTVTQGQLTGVVTPDGQVEIYTGIPYAKPPVGELRWREPQDPEPWEGVLAADHYAPMSMQARNPEFVNSMVDIIGYHDYTVSLNDSFRDLVSEDSLYLNIWKPAGELSGAPVLVYIHGGSLTGGQPWYADYSGEGLAREGVIVVNMGYRLGVFGFFADEALAAESSNGTTGNYGLLDQIKALEWVRDNIAAFGGDPDNVTLAGESAGSACVTAICASPLGRGLFRRAIAESSTVTAPEPAHSYRSLEAALAAGEAVKEHFHVSTPEELRALSAKDLLWAFNNNHHITVDGYALTEDPYLTLARGECNAEAILHGYNKTEGALFILFDNANLKNYADKIRKAFPGDADRVLSLWPAETDQQARDNWIEIYSAVIFDYGHYCLTRQALRAGIPVYQYWFTKENKRLGFNHGGEEVYFYNNIPPSSHLYDQSDYDLEAVMRSYFVNFIANGDPNGEGLPVWDAARDPAVLMELGSRLGPAPERYAELYAILDKAQRWQD